MVKVSNPKDLFPTIIEDYRNIFSDGLQSIILYGSAAGIDYQPGGSDINFLIILSEDAIGAIEAALKTVARWRKKKVATPLFMTKQYILSSLDSYPLEFLTMKHEHVLVFGEDVLEPLVFDAGDLRLQCERDIKGKLVLLRRGFLETEGRDRHIRELIAASLTAFISIFKGLLYLKEQDIPPSRREVIGAVADTFALDRTTFLRCLQIKEGTGRFSPQEVRSLLKSYLAEIKKLWEAVDRMEL
ncbi:MAG: hypothetical protein JXO48_06930 [Deltaproteobacteria bacterium]|nr:hypothetical protein [Deltaproteobacteria bacterium]